MSLDHIERKIQELAIEFEKCHLVYLQIDDSPLKLEQRRKLEDLIEDYLCLVSSDRKFIFGETADILYKSATTFKDFSGYKASTGWSAISLYASNLLSQPWRKEYKSIRTFCGYFKHEIEANLVGAEVMFELMGYSHNGIGILCLNGPIDPDKVSNVSRDAIVAFVECKIIKQIWEKASNTFNVSWLEVLEFRKNYAGAPDQAIRALNYRYIERLNHHSIFKNELKPRLIKNRLDNKYLLQDLSYQRNNNNCHNNFVCGVPNHRYQYDLRKSPSEVTKANCKFEGRSAMTFSKQINSSSFVNDEYLKYPINEEKFDVINSPSLSSKIYTSDTKTNINANKLNDFHHPESKLNIVQISVKNKTYDVQVDCTKRKGSTIIRNISHEVKGRSSNNTVSKTIEQTTTSENLINLNQKINNWNCETCTYTNMQEHNVCQMCGKSRKKGNEDEPLISGGKECPKCTLVNKKDVNVCDACETSLNDSPTYI